MSNKTKLIEELRSKAGMSWAAATRTVVASASAVANDGEIARGGALGALLTSLGATSAFRVQVGRARAWGFASEEPGDATLEMREAKRKPPAWWAETGTAFRKITAREFRLLRAAGAADASEVQVLRARVDEYGIGYSLACEKCNWFIRCGVVQREATCFCGHRYRVVFDRDDSPWWFLRGGHCVACLAKLGQDGEAHAMNEWQAVCAACAADPYARR